MTSRRGMNKAYVVAQWAWGAPQTFVGFVLFMAHRRSPHRRYRSAIVTYWPSEAGLSLGLFLFLPRWALDPADERARGRAAALHRHEFGHTIQSLLLGPLYLVVIGVPSLVWAGFPPVARQWRRGERGYYSFWTEKTADALSARFSSRS